MNRAACFFSSSLLSMPI